ncbi:MAG: terpene cyclase/mutase family protein [Myxococcales bacterium]|nr:terpene cyclase/mutase family protein [Myxococcales bacterium]
MIGTESNHASSASKEILARLRAMRTASPVARASSFLERSCGLVHGFQLRVGLAPDLSDPVVPTLVETFSSMLILDLLVDTEVDPRIPEHLARYIAGHQEDGMFWFFEDTSLVPPDVDTVAVGLAALARSGAVSLAEPVASAAIDRIVSNQSSSGVIQVYFPPRGGRQERVDPVVCANVLYLLHLAGRGDEARATEDFVYSVLERRSYLEGTRYYLAPETFLCLLARVLRVSPSFRARFRPLLRKRVEESLVTGDAHRRPLSAAQRLMAANDTGLEARRDVELLLRSQGPDGSWEAHALGATGNSQLRLYFGSRALTTAFALHALTCYPGTLEAR